MLEFSNNLFDDKFDNTSNGAISSHFEPTVNVDGTPMSIFGNVDVLGKPYGVSDSSNSDGFHSDLFDMSHSSTFDNFPTGADFNSFDDFGSD